MNSLYEIENGIFIVENKKAIYIEKIDSVVISDLQIGYELSLAKKGIMVPQFQLEKMLNDLKFIKKVTGAKQLIINGDLKHEFSEASRQEWREVKKFLEVSTKMFKKLVIVRGNHDNYLLNILSKFDIPLYNPLYTEKEYCFTHGHKVVEVPYDCKYLFIGHEEPTIVLKKDFQKIKVPCVLKGKWKGITLICLPAFSPISSGTEVNLIEKGDFLSPILQQADVDNFEVFVIEEEVGVLYFGKLKNLRVI